MTLHPIWHYTSKCTSSQRTLHREECMFSRTSTSYQMWLHPKCTSSQRALHPKCTSSQSALNPISHFIPQAISSHNFLHPMSPFIKQVTLSYWPLHPGYHLTWKWVIDFFLALIIFTNIWLRILKIWFYPGYKKDSCFYGFKTESKNRKLINLVV